MEAVLMGWEALSWDGAGPYGMGWAVIEEEGLL